MSLSGKINITCSKCRKDYEATVYQTVDTALHENVAKDIITWELFRQTCPHCGNTVTLNYPLLYHDLQRKAVVWVAPVEPGREAKLAEMRKNMALPDHTTRLVAGLDQLREKVSALETGRDDRVLELLKWSLVQNLQKQMPDFKLREVLYLYLDGEEGFHFYSTDGRYLHSPLVQEQYDFVKTKFAKQLKILEGKPYPEVNYLWASTLWANA
ncbi:MAG: CpXC domain-containing protein [Oscillospiraceae bacterium]|nr:CpXC domain-containing protein [Oscillospiraceae bacterium]